MSLDKKINLKFGEDYVVLEINGDTMYDKLKFAIKNKFTVEKTPENIIIESSKGIFKISKNEVSIIDKHDSMIKK